MPVCLQYDANARAGIPYTDDFGCIWETVRDGIEDCEMFLLADEKLGRDWVIEKIKLAVKDLKNVTVVRCFDMVPKDAAFFADLRLHPNDAGFDHYFQNLHSAVLKPITD